MNEGIITVKDVATMLHSSTATIYTMCREGEIPHFRVRGKILFHKDDVMKWTKEKSSNNEIASI